jgi:hypothetical protein
MLGKREECWGKEENAGEKSRMPGEYRRMLWKRVERRENIEEC